MTPTTTAQTDRRMNGISLNDLHDTIKAIRQKPELGASKFRATNRWLGKALNESAIGDYYVAGEERKHQRKFVFQADEGRVLLGDDQAANPVEYLLHALAACMTTTTVYHAAARGISIRRIETSLEGDIDLRGFLGLSPDTRKGYSEIRVRMEIESDAPDEKIKELKSLYRFSPVFGTVTEPTRVQVEVEPK